MSRARITTPSSMGEALDFLRSAMEDRGWVALFASCKALYEGRGASESSEGDVLVIIKPDRTIIVHGPSGYKPLNWQPSGSAITLSEQSGHLEIRALRRSPRELLVLECGRVYAIAALQAPQSPEFYMYLSESEIRDVLVEHPELIEEGLRIAGIERPVEPGFIDMYGYDREGRLVVFEIKRVKAGEQAARQLLRYIEAIKTRGLKDVRGILLAPDFTESAIRLLELSGLEYKRLDLRRLYELASKRLSARGTKSLLDYMRGSKE